MMEHKFYKGSLINQILSDGTLFGGDYDGRLGPLTYTLMKYRPFKDKVVLDLGSNAGHFPIEYIRNEAKKVIAVEGRPEFEEQWNLIKDLLPGIDSSRVDWHTADVRKFETEEKYNILTCLGLVYHINGIWEHLIRLATDNVELIIIESEIWPKKGQHTNRGGDRTHALEDCITDDYTLVELRKALMSSFPTWYITEILLFGWWAVRLHEPKYKGFKHNSRGLWFLTKEKDSDFTKPKKEVEA